MKKSSFKSKLKVLYDSNLGMWHVSGESLTRTIRNATFYDKISANTFKKLTDNNDFHYYWNNN